MTKITHWEEDEVLELGDDWWIGVGYRLLQGLWATPSVGFVGGSSSVTILGHRCSHYIFANKNKWDGLTLDNLADKSMFPRPNSEGCCYPIPEGILMMFKLKASGL